MMRQDFTKSPLSADDLCRFGLDDFAYVKPVTIAGQRFHVVHAADGTPLMIATERTMAFAAVREQDMEPISVH
jgi:hypothetical protein